MASEVNFRCKHCGQGLWIRDLGSAQEIACDRCGWSHSTEPQRSVDSEGFLYRCGVCGCEDMYRQRDFNRKLGLAVVVVAALFSVKTYGLSLLVAAIIDLGLYLGLPEIVLCYHCESIHRGFKRHPRIESYDLATHERFEDRDWGKAHETEDA